MENENGSNTIDIQHSTNTNLQTSGSLRISCIYCSREYVKYVLLTSKLLLLLPHRRMLQQQPLNFVGPQLLLFLKFYPLCFDIALNTSHFHFLHGAYMVHDEENLFIRTRNNVER